MSTDSKETPKDNSNASLTNISPKPILASLSKWRHQVNIHQALQAALNQRATRAIVLAGSLYLLRLPVRPVHVVPKLPQSKQQQNQLIACFAAITPTPIPFPRMQITTKALNFNTNTHF